MGQNNKSRHKFTFLQNFTMGAVNMSYSSSHDLKTAPYSTSRRKNIRKLTKTSKTPIMFCVRCRRPSKPEILFGVFFEKKVRQQRLILELKVTK